jgi:PAS domain S-box-containing protein
MKILIVDDNPDDRRVLRYMVERHGHQSVEAQNGVEGLEQARADVPDLIVSDALMPGMDGFQFLRSVKQEAGLRSVPFIFYSASYREEKDVRLAMSLGADAYLVKPVDPVELWEKVERLLVMERSEKAPPGPLVEEDAEYLKCYSEVVATQLEEKVRELERTVQQQQSAERALRASEERLCSTLEATQIVAWEADLVAGQFHETGPVARLFGQGEGFKHESIESLVDDVHPDDRRDFQIKLAEALRGESCFRQEYRISLSDGTIRWIAAIGDLQRDAQGRPKRFLGLAREITDLKRTEMALRKVSRAVEQSPDSIVITDSTGNIEYVNPKFSEVTGYALVEVLGQNPRILKSGEMPPEQYRQMWQAITSGRDWRGEFHNRRKNGTLYWESATISPVRDTRGVITHFLAIKQDITEHKLALERIREQAALLDQTQDAILVLGLNRHLRYLNRSAERFYAPRPGPLDDLDAPSLLFQEHPERCAEVCQATMEGGHWSGEITGITALGVRRVVRSRWSLVHDTAGRPFSFLIVNTDVTEQKRLEEQFLHAQRMEGIGTLASGVAHDLNNILSPILMAADMLRPVVTKPEDLEVITLLENGARRGADIIKQLLTYGRGVEGERVAVQPRSLLKEMVKVIRETFPKNITVEQQIPENLWTVLADPTQIHQVLLNLCINARDAMPQGGRLTITAENLIVDAAYTAVNPEARPGPCVVLRVGDTGTGIPPEILHKIFDPFFTTKEPGKGTGLGLSTVLGIVKSHEGFVQVDSRMGEGTQFKVYLPASVESTELPPEPSTDPMPEAHGELVLLVDDEDSVRAVGRYALESSGFRVITAADGAEALMVFSRSRVPIRAVVTDMIMPVMDGAALIRALRRHSPDLPLVAMCGLSDEESVAVQAGISRNAFLHKPFSTAKLVRMLHKVLGECQAM